MQRDQSVKYNLGFGITPSNYPITQSREEDSNVDPNSGFIAKALHGHPIARFLTAGVVTAVAAGVATNIAKGGGVRLGRFLSEDPTIRRTWRTELLDNFRRTQRTLDRWEGLGRIRDEEGFTQATFNRGGFFISHEDQIKAAEARARGQYAEPMPVWAWRDEIQKRLVSRARAMPYELPAIYAAGKIAGRITEQPSERERVNWYNPVDVIGDFAQNSVKSIASMMLPWDTGSALAHHGWRRLMTYGDVVSNTQTFNPHIHNFSVTLQSSLSSLGQSASKIIYDTTKKSSQVAGSLGTAINESFYERKPSGFLYSGKIQSGLRGYKEQRAEDSTRYDSAKGAARRAFPTISNFLPAFKRRYNYLEQINRNFEAILTGKPNADGIVTYKMKDREGVEHEYPVNHSLIPSDNPYMSDFERFANILQREEPYTTPGGYARGGFARTQQRALYLRNLQQNLLEHEKFSSTDERIEYAKSVNEFINRARLNTLPRFGRSARPTTPEEAARQRIGFGTTSLKTGGEWTANLSQRLSQVIPESHARRIASSIGEAVRVTDIPFLDRDFQRESATTIQSQWNDLYRRAIIPAIKDRTREVRLPSELANEGMSSNIKEMFTRRLAASMGVPIEDVSTSDLKKTLAKHGLDVSDIHTLRGQLLDRGIVSKPWQKQGFNLLGLRPLSVAEGLQRNIFHPGVRDKIAQLNQDVSDTYMKDTSSLQLGRGLYMTSSGQVLDLRSFFGSVRKLNDLAARYFQIPVLGFSPYDLIAYNARRSIRNQPILQISANLGKQFQGTELAGEEPENLIYVGGKRPGRGSLYGFSHLGSTGQYRGTFRPVKTGGESIVARQTRLGLGDSGFHREPFDNSTLKGKVQNWLDLNPRQQDSLYDIWNRAKRSRIANRAKQARGEKVSDDLLNTPNFARELLDWDPKKPITSEHIGATYNIENELHYNFAYTPGVANRLMQFAQGYSKYENLRDLFTVIDPITGAPTRLSDIKDASQMFDTVQALLKEDEEKLQQDVAEGRKTGFLRRDLNSAQSFLRESYLSQRGTGAMEETSARSIRSTGIHRRIDEFRNDVYRYIVAREALIGDDGNKVITDLLSALDSMKAQNLLSHRDYIESRAAVLGTQFHISNIRSYRLQVDEASKTKSLLKDVTGTKGVRPVLQEMADYHMRIFGHPDALGIRRRIASRIGLAAEPKETRIFPTSPHQSHLYVPTSKTSFLRNPIGALKSLTGYSNWSDPKNFSMGSMVSGHLAERLDRYFSLFHAGIDPNKYRGALSYYTVGMVGKRVLPIVAGASILNTADRTLGYAFGGTGPDHKHHYKPFVGGAIATTVANLEVALTPGKERRERKREELFGDRDVPIRSGRYWLIGSSQFSGGRTMYYRPDWYRRYMSGYQYSDQGWHSPLEQALYGYDYSPLRPIDPYRYEREHYGTRPYPTTGQYFSGPWGPLTSALNITAGKILKPSIFMHQRELASQMQNYQYMGQQGMAFSPQPPGVQPLVAAKSATGGVSTYGTPTVGQLLNQQASIIAQPNPQGNTYPFRQDYATTGVPFGTYKNQRYIRGSTEIAQALSTAPTMQPSGQQISNQMIGAVNQGYVDASGDIAVNKNAPGFSSTYRVANKLTAPYNKVLMVPNRQFDPRVVLAANPVNQNSLKFQAGQYGYEMQEMAGIYGFGAGTVKQSLGLGRSDFAPQKPVYQSADRAYGSERSFWDLNLGGLGDIPLYGTSEFGNIEISEIIRRFVPHRRREINEVNPIRNTVYPQNPWLPGPDYFQDFSRGDIYSSIQEGEMRLPGQGYEALHRLQSGQPGQYGPLDQLAILGNVAPWSSQYRALSMAVGNMQLSPEQRNFAKNVREQVAEIKKRHTFHPYKYKSNITKEQVQVTGYAPGEADTLMTTAGPVSFAGLHLRTNKVAANWLQQNIKPGQDINITYDQNYPPARNQPIEAIIEAGGENVNQTLLSQPQIAYPSRSEQPIDRYFRESPLEFKLHALEERLEHMNSWVNEKFIPHRTAIEDWERQHVYGSSFPTWNEPYQSFIRPLGYRAMNRNPISAAITLGIAGRLFFREPEGKAFGTIAGAVAGLGISLLSGAKNIQTGRRFLPQPYEKAESVNEYADILNYVKYSRMYSQERQAAIQQEGTDPEQLAKQLEKSRFKAYQYANIGPNTVAALGARQKMQSTMYGANVFGDVMNLSASIPRNQRDYFMEFLNAPVDERMRILSVLPRLERRMFEARWGMKVEKRPDLKTYFSQHELPGPSWEGWSPAVDIEDVKIKMMQSQGVNLSQQGYYPQQISEANALNYSYPTFNKAQSPDASAAQLQRLFTSNNMAGSVRIVPTSGNSSIELQAGVSN